MTQLERLLQEYGENRPHIERLEREAKLPMSPPPVWTATYQKPKPADPWPAHMRFDG